MPDGASRTAVRGLRRRSQRGLNRLLGNGALRAKLNRGLARANLELVIRGPEDKFEPEFREFLARCDAYTMTSRERMYAVYQAARYVHGAGVPGDVVECGVWRSGSSMMAALALLACGDSTRRFWLYDTFAGMPPPSDHDFGLRGEDAHEEWRRSQRDRINEWCYAPLDDARANMLSTGLTGERLELVQGLVEETIPNRVPRRIALLRLDTDWYESTLHELVHLFPRLSPGGVLILDDYGHWAGVREAVEHFLAAQGITLLLNRIDYAGRIAIRT